MNQMSLGKLPPQAIDAERAVLSALLVDNEAPGIVFTIIYPNAFYKDDHIALAEGIKAVFDKGIRPDIITVTDQLRSTGRLEEAGGAFAIAEMSDYVSSAANVEHHARIVMQKFIARELIRIGSDVVREGYDDTVDPIDLLDRAMVMHINLMQGLYSGHITRFGDAILAGIKSTQKNTEDRRNGVPVVLGYPSGLKAWDHITGGNQPTDLNIIAGRPGMGKTALLLNSAIACADVVPVAIISLEMSATQLALRAISEATNIPTNRMRSGDISNSELDLLVSDLVSRISERPIYISDKGALNVSKLRGVVEQLVAKYGVRVVYLDYLQLMSGSDPRNREREIAEISRTAKLLAKDLNICFNAFSQLNRDVERRGGNKRPQLSDLRESGAIEQDADNITFIYRPEYYGITADEFGKSLANRAELIVAKARHNSPGTAEVAFFPGSSRFCDLSVAETMPIITSRVSRHWQDDPKPEFFDSPNSFE